MHGIWIFTIAGQLYVIVVIQARSEDMCVTEDLTRRRFLRQALGSVGAVLSWPATWRGRSIRPRAARRACDLLDSMGVCSSVTARGETIDGTMEALSYTGLRWIRCGLEDDIQVQGMIRIHQQTGARFAYGLLSGGVDLASLLGQARQLARAGALLALEGNNEPNNWPIRYKDRKGGADHSWLPVAWLQRDLWQAAKEDAVLKGVPVWNISESGAQTDNVGLQFLTIPPGAQTLMPAGTNYADCANCHNYLVHPSWPGLHDNQTWLGASPFRDCPVDGLYKNYGLTWRGRFAGYRESVLASLPRVTTETGYPAASEEQEGVQACLYLNLYLSQFKRGWSHTAIYLLRPRSGEPEHKAFALYRADYTPKPAARYLHNLTTILAEPGRVARPGELAYLIPDQPATVHDLLVQMSDGRFMLILWGERFTGGSDHITVEFSHAGGTIGVYDPTIGAGKIEERDDLRSLSLAMTDHPVIVEIGCR